MFKVLCRLVTFRMWKALGSGENHEILRHDLGTGSVSPLWRTRLRQGSGQDHQKPLYRKGQPRKGAVWGCRSECPMHPSVAHGFQMSLTTGDGVPGLGGRYFRLYLFLSHFYELQTFHKALWFCPFVICNWVSEEVELSYFSIESCCCWCMCWWHWC